jgi:hypothetical protein
VPRGTVSGFDPDRPSVARVYDVLAGGYDNFAADRDEAARLLEACPGLPALVRENRAFLGRAVTWTSRQGIDQFIDLGSGFPVAAEFRRKENLRDNRPDADIHASAQAVNPDARVTYVDADPEVTDHADAVLALSGVHDVAAVRADLRDPGTVLADQGLRKLIEPAEPVCLILGLVLNLMSARRAREVVAGYADLVAPGSYVVISCARFDDDVMWKGLRAACTAAAPRNHTRRQIAGFLAGLEPVPPGLVSAQGWRGGWGDTLPVPPGSTYVLAGVARKR